MLNTIFFVEDFKNRQINVKYSQLTKNYNVHLNQRNYFIRGVVTIINKACLSRSFYVCAGRLWRRSLFAMMIKIMTRMVLLCLWGQWDYNGRHCFMTKETLPDSLLLSFQNKENAPIPFSSLSKSHFPLFDCKRGEYIQTEYLLLQSCWNPMICWTI